MRIVFKNLRILYGKDLELIRGNIVVEDGIIVEISDKDYKESIDMKNGIAIPSFTNAHTHIVDRICSDKYFYNPIEKIVGRDGFKFKCLSEANYEEKIKAIKECISDMYKYATHVFCDFREEGLQGVLLLKDILKDERFIKPVILGRVNDINETGKLLEIADGLGIPDINFMDLNSLKRLRNICKERNKLFAIHCSETRRELDLCIKLIPDFLIHLTYADDYDLNLIEKYKIPVVICPRANSSYAVGIPRIKELFEITKVAIGTDNVMMNSLNIFREIEYTFKVARALYKDYKFDAKDILKAATINGREILKLKTNEIIEGNIADFIIFRNKCFINDVYLAIIHRYDFSDIKVVVKNDEVIFR